LVSAWSLPKLLLIAVLSAFVALGVLGCTGDTLQVGDVFQNPAEYQHEVTLTATVTGFSAESTTVFNIVDNAYIIQCGNLNCGTTRMFANSVGGAAMPALGDVVEMTGSFEWVGGVWIFMANSITVEDNVLDRLAPM